MWWRVQTRPGGLQFLPKVQTGQRGQNSVFQPHQRQVGYQTRQWWSLLPCHWWDLRPQCQEKIKSVINKVEAQGVKASTCMHVRDVGAWWAQWARAHPLFAEIWMKWVKWLPTFSYHNDNILFLFAKFLGWKFLCPPTFWRLPTSLELHYLWNFRQLMKGTKIKR